MDGADTVDVLVNGGLIAITIGGAAVRGKNEVDLGHVELMICCSVCFDACGASTVAAAVVAASITCSLDPLGCLLLLHQSIVKILWLRCVLIFDPSCLKLFDDHLLLRRRFHA